MKVALGFLIAAQLFTTPAITLNIAESNMTEIGYEAVGVKGEEPTREEEFMWFYRVYNGKDQKRLWSLTYLRWVTDWIDCD